MRLILLAVSSILIRDADGSFFLFFDGAVKTSTSSVTLAL